jgi:hypothetical protein
MSVLAAASAFAIGTVFVAGAQTSGDVEITVSVEAVGITITGGDLNFGGPHPPNQQVAAHPSPTDGVLGVASAPTITNSGNVPLNYIDVTYGGPVGAEASCDEGASSWPARVTSNPAGFLMRARAGGSTTYSTFASSALSIAPGTGTGNILANVPLEGSAEVPLYLYLRLPQTPAGGGSGCTIDLVVTASAS